MVRTASSRDVCSDEEERRCVCRVPLGVVRRSPFMWVRCVASMRVRCGCDAGGKRARAAAACARCSHA
eukprot:scaffold15457_cov66-Phaeocystis_antarctica.AAC.4